MLHPLLVLNLHENNHNFPKASFNWKGNLCNTNHCKFTILNRCSSTSIASDSSRQDKRPAYRLGWLYRIIAHLLPADFLLSSSKSRLHHATAKALLLVNHNWENFPRQRFPWLVSMQEPVQPKQSLSINPSVDKWTDRQYGYSTLSSQIDK